MAWYRDEAMLRAEVEKHGSVNAAAHANATPASTVSNWAQRLGVKSFNPRTPKGLRGDDWPKPPPPLIPILDTPIRLEGDMAVSSDWHAPATNYEVLHRMLDDIDRSGLKRLGIIGDLTNQDALAGHEEKQKGAELEPEMEHLHYSVDLALDVVDEIVVSFGNHDRHAMGRLQVSFEKSIGMLLHGLAPEKLARIRITALDHVTVETERGDWLLAHTRSYSRLPLAYPNKLAQRHGCHVAAGHRHHAAQGRAANGKDIVELAGLMDIPRLAYAHRYTNDLPAMQNGYGLLIDGFMRCPMLYS